MQKGYICFIIQKHLEPFSLFTPLLTYTEHNKLYKQMLHKRHLSMCDSNTQSKFCLYMYKDVLARSTEGHANICVFESTKPNQDTETLFERCMLQLTWHLNIHKHVNYMQTIRLTAFTHHNFQMFREFVLEVHNFIFQNKKSKKHQCYNLR